MVRLRVLGTLDLTADQGESAAELLPLLEHCHSTPGVHVVDCPIDYSDNDRILNKELRERAAELVPG